MIGALIGLHFQTFSFISILMFRTASKYEQENIFPSDCSANQRERQIYITAVQSATLDITGGEMPSVHPVISRMSRSNDLHLDHLIYRFKHVLLFLNQAV